MRPATLMWQDLHEHQWREEEPPIALIPTRAPPLTLALAPEGLSLMKQRAAVAAACASTEQRPTARQRQWPTPTERLRFWRRQRSLTMMAMLLPPPLLPQLLRMVLVRLKLVLPLLVAVTTMP